MKALLKLLCLSAIGFLSFSCVFSYKAKNTSAVKAINNRDNSPIKSREIRRSKFADITAKEEVKKLIDSGILIP